jgi:recombination protein RecT
MIVAKTNLAEISSMKPSEKVKLPANTFAMGEVKKFFETQRGTLAAVLPRHVSADRMLKIALGALRTTPKLMNCTIESLMGAVVQCSQLGLEPNTPLGHAYLIPFDKNKKEGNQWVYDKTEVQIVIGYKGLIDLARRSGQVVSIAAHEVCEKDEFEYSYGLDETLTHKPALGDRGNIIAFYAVAKLVGGGHAFEVMSHQQVIDIRDESQGWKMAVRNKKTDSNPWGGHFAEMGRKTALRRLFKYLPVSIEVAQASALDELGSRGHSQALDNVLDGDYVTPTAEPDDDGVLSIENSPTESAPAFDLNGFKKRITECKDLEALEVLATDLDAVPQGAERASLEEAYRNRRKDLTE